MNDLIPPKSTIRVGHFVPELYQSSQTNRGCTGCHFSMRRPVGQNRWFHGSQLGVEVAGTIGGRVRYVAGVVEWNGNLQNSSKDPYARVAVKIGGLALDGRGTKGAGSAADNWVDNSVETGAFVYWGNPSVDSKDTSGKPVTLDDRFLVLGGDIFATFGNLALYGLGIFEKHSRPTYDRRDVWVERYVARARYVVLPWLIPEVTFEYFNTELDNDMTYQVAGSVDVLVRANVKLWVEVIGRRDVLASFGFNSARLVLDVGF